MNSKNLNSLSASELTAKLTYGTWRFQKNWKPLHVVDAEGCFFIDATGKRYLEFSAQLMCVHLGYKNKAVTNAIEEQARKLPFIGPGFATDVRAELSKQLLTVLPQGLEKFFFATSGTEANEAAIKIARLYAKGKSIENPAIVVMEKAFHGRTLATLSATGSRKVQAGFEPLVSGFVRVPYDDLDAVRQVAQNNRNVVAVLVEPIQGEGGINVARTDYLRGLAEICDRNEWLLIAD
jgi:acetylornithine/N-succinyldiaminopimelate aminotransferase